MILILPQIFGEIPVINVQYAGLTAVAKTGSLAEVLWPSKISTQALLILRDQNI